MTQSITTSIRLSPELRERLDYAAKKLHRGKNWIIAHALQEYIEKIDISELSEEARRQSLLASKKKHSEDNNWEDESDLSDWS